MMTQLEEMHLTCSTKHFPCILLWIMKMHRIFWGQKSKIRINGLIDESNCVGYFPSIWAHGRETLRGNYTLRESQMYRKTVNY